MTVGVLGQFAAALLTLLVATFQLEANSQEQALEIQPSAECVSKVQASLELLQVMQRDGIDLAKSRTITHLFMGPDDAVAHASTSFAEQGFDVLEAGEGQLLLGAKASLSAEWVSQTIPAMCVKAAELGMSYDGWDVDVAGEQSDTHK